MANLLATAIHLTALHFIDKTDKGGEPYIMHCLFVMNQMPEEDHELRCIAVMHDLLEDTDVTSGDLQGFGFSERVILGLHYMTHPEGLSYDEYIKRIANNEDARKVKLADLTHNSQIMRMKGLRKQDFDRLEKYHRAYAYLSY